MCERIVILLRTRCFSLPLACRSPVVKSLGIVRPNANGLTEVLHRSVKVTFNAVSRESGGGATRLPEVHAAYRGENLDLKPQRM